MIKMEMHGNKMTYNPNTREITGNTFPEKNRLRKMGCKWNPTNKSWVLPEGSEGQIKRYWVEETTTTTRKPSPLCPKCKTYSEGDC